MRARGFSLVESMVAALLLAGGLLALIAAMRAMARLDELGRRSAEAAATARSLLAQRHACAGVSGNVAGTTVTTSFVHDGRTTSVSLDASWWCGRAP